MVNYKTIIRAEQILIIILVAILVSSSIEPKQDFFTVAFQPGLKYILFPYYEPM